MEKKKILKPKQQQFCQEYLIDLNATKAATRAGYSKKTAYSQGQRLLKNVEIQRAIKKITIRTCPECGEPLRKRQRFCGKCAKKHARQPLGKRLCRIV